MTSAWSTMSSLLVLRLCLSHHIVGSQNIVRYLPATLVELHLRFIVPDTTKWKLPFGLRYLCWEYIHTNNFYSLDLSTCVHSLQKLRLTTSPTSYSPLHSDHLQLPPLFDCLTDVDIDNATYDIGQRFLRHRLRSLRLLYSTHTLKDDHETPSNVWDPLHLPTSLDSLEWRRERRGISYDYLRHTFIPFTPLPSLQLREVRLECRSRDVGSMCNALEVLPFVHLVVLITSHVDGVQLLTPTRTPHPYHLYFYHVTGGGKEYATLFNSVARLFHTDFFSSQTHELSDIEIMRLEHHLRYYSSIDDLPLPFSRLKEVGGWGQDKYHQYKSLVESIAMKRAQSPSYIVIHPQYTDHHHPRPYHHHHHPLQIGISHSVTEWVRSWTLKSSSKSVSSLARKGCAVVLRTPDVYGDVQWGDRTSVCSESENHRCICRRWTRSF